jgi:tetratricopeptide (TPR) repeat protein
MGQNAILDTDVADTASGMPGRPVGGFGNPGVGTTGNGDNRNANWNCELRASYPGYRSDVVELSNHRFLDDPNVGTIILHRLGNGESAGTISLTSALVPKHAQKDYEKGVELAEKGKFEDAEKRLLAATAAYPKYAIAWFALGELQQREGHTEAARKSYESAIAADAKYASPYDQLALLSAEGQEWQAAANYSQQAIALDSVDFPSSLWYNALANYRLNHSEEAEKTLRELLRVDTAHHYPEAERLYAQMLLTQGNYDGAATHLHAYLAIAPKGQGAAAAKELLGKLDQAKTAPAK